MAKRKNSLKADLLTGNKDKFIKLEYDSAQRSAEHHDNQIWIISSIFSIMEVTLIGSVVTNPTNGLLSAIIALIGIAGALFMIIFTCTIRYTKRQKYDFCKKVEERFLGPDCAKVWGQHTSPCYPFKTGWMLTILFCLFILFWIIYIGINLCP